MQSFNGAGAQNVENLARHAFEGERWQEAVGFLRQVVDRVVQQSAHVEAKVHIERALSALDRLPEGPELLAHGIDFRLDLKTVLFALGEVGAISAHLDDAVRLADALGDAPRRARVRYHTCHHFWYTGEHRRALESGQDAQRIATEAGDDQARVEILQRLGSVHHALGNYRAGIEVLQQSDIGVEERSDSPGTPSIFARMFLIWCLAETGDFRAAIPAAEENFCVAEQSGLPWAIIDASLGVGVAHLAQGRPDRALSALGRGVELCETGDLPALLPWVTTYLATAQFRCGRAEDGVALLERAIEQAQEMGILSYQALRATRLAEGYLRSGRLDDAGDTARRALELARVHSERGHEAWALWIQAEVVRRVNSSVQFAEEQYREALDVADELGMRPLAAHCHYGLANLRQPNEQTETDRKHLVTMTALCAEMGMVSHPLNALNIRLA
jgi:tetratricopeptide (TPR) repeat protein